MLIQFSQPLKDDTAKQFISRVALFALYILVGFQTFLVDNLDLSELSLTDELLIAVCFFTLIIQSLHRLLLPRSLIFLIAIFVVLGALSTLGLTVTWAQVIVGYLDIYKNLFMVLGLPLLLRSMGISSKQIELSLIAFIYASIAFSLLFYLFPTSFLNAHQEHMRMGIYRLGGLVSDINSYALVLTTLFFAVQLGFLKVKRRKMLSILLLLMIFLTFSRSTILITIAGLALVNAPRMKYFLAYLITITVILSAMTIHDARIISASNVPSSEFVWNPISTMDVVEDFDKTQYRLVVYLKSFQMFVESPIWGHGLGTFGTPISLIEGSPLYKLYGFPQVEFVDGGFNVQDVYYPILYVQSGLIGLMLFLTISYKVMVNMAGQENRKLFLLLYAIFLVLAINSMTFMVGSLMFFFSLLISIATLRRAENKHASTTV